MSSACDEEPSNRQKDVIGDRRNPRVAHHLVVRFRNRRLNRWEVFPLKDFSREGARFLSTEAFEPNSVLELVFGLPLFSKRTSLSARVVWQKPIYSGRLRMTEYGVRFSSLEPDMHQALLEAVRRYLKITGGKQSS